MGQPDVEQRLAGGDRFSLDDVDLRDDAAERGRDAVLRFAGTLDDHAGERDVAFEVAEGDGEGFVADVLEGLGAQLERLGVFVPGVVVGGVIVIVAGGVGVVIFRALGGAADGGGEVGGGLILLFAAP